MKSSVLKHNRLVFGIALALLVRPGVAGAQPRQSTISLESLPRDQFEKLPADQPVTFRGRQMTKTQFLLEVRQTRKTVLLGSTGQLDTALIEKQFLEKEKARLLRKNAPRLQRGQADSKSLQEKRSGVLVCLTPKIKETDPPPIEPTDTVRLTGSGFGKEPGEVRLLGAFPGGSLKPPVKHYFYPSGPYWYDGMIDVVAPSVSAVNDHQANFR